MIRKCETAEDMRRLEAEMNYFYTHGGPAIDDNFYANNECAMTETEQFVPSTKTAVKKSTPTDHTEWRSVVRGGLEAEIAYFYEHGGPIMN